MGGAPSNGMIPIFLPKDIPLGLQLDQSPKGTIASSGGNGPKEWGNGFLPKAPLISFISFLSMTYKPFPKRS